MPKHKTGVEWRARTFRNVYFCNGTYRKLVNGRGLFPNNRAAQVLNARRRAQYRGVRGRPANRRLYYLCTRHATAGLRLMAKNESDNRALEQIELLFVAQLDRAGLSPPRSS